MYQIFESLGDRLARVPATNEESRLRVFHQFRRLGLQSPFSSLSLRLTGRKTMQTGVTRAPVDSSYKHRGLDKLTLFPGSAYPSFYNVGVYVYLLATWVGVTGSYEATPKCLLTRSLGVAGVELGLRETPASVLLAASTEP